MKNPPNIVIFAGSLRKESYNKKLASLAAKIAASEGAKVTYLDLSEYPLPLFDEDIEAKSTPNSLLKLRDIFSKADGLIITSPEYNGSYSAALKNIIDWLSRPAKDESYQPAFSRLSVGIASASPGALGGIRGLSHLRALMGDLGCLVIPNQLAIPAAYEAFDEQGQLNNPVFVDHFQVLVKKVIALA